MKEKKTGQNRVSKSEEHNCVHVADVRSMSELRIDFVADPEMMIMSEVLLLNSCLHTIELKKNKLGDDGVAALARAVGTSRLPIKVRPARAPPAPRSPPSSPLPSPSDLSPIVSTCPPLRLVPSSHPSPSRPSPRP